MPGNAVREIKLQIIQFVLCPHIKSISALSHFKRLPFGQVSDCFIGIVIDSGLLLQNLQHSPYRLDGKRT